MNKELRAYVVRTLVVLATGLAGFIVATSHSKSKLNSFPCLANYKRWTGIMYFVVVHFVACIYNFAVLFLIKGSHLWRPVILVDMIFVLLQSTSWAAAFTSYLYMKNGNSNVGWPGICNFAPDQFCGKILGALVAGGIGCLFSFFSLCTALQHAFDFLLTGS